MLSIKNVQISFGKSLVLNNCSLQITRGSIIGIIGPNGSGKTTLFNCISGLLKPTGGSIMLNNDSHGHELPKLLPHQIARLGVGRTFQLNRVFKRMSALDNLLVAAFDRARADELLKLVGLSHLSDHPAGKLSIGQQRLLEIARALMLKPKLVLLDEPTSGVSPTIIGTLAEQIKQIQLQEHVTFLIVEHNLKFVLALSDTIYVLSAGEVIASGPPSAIRTNRTVIDAYLGSHHAQH